MPHSPLIFYRKNKTRPAKGPYLDNTLPLGHLAPQRQDEQHGFAFLVAGEQHATGVVRVAAFEAGQRIHSNPSMGNPGTRPGSLFFKVWRLVTIPSYALQKANEPLGSGRRLFRARGLTTHRRIPSFEDYPMCLERKIGIPHTSPRRAGKTSRLGSPLIQGSRPSWVQLGLWMKQETVRSSSVAKGFFPHNDGTPASDTATLKK